MSPQIVTNNSVCKSSTNTDSLYYPLLFCVLGVIVAVIIMGSVFGIYFVIRRYSYIAC